MNPTPKPELTYRLLKLIHDRGCVEQSADLTLTPSDLKVGQVSSQEVVHLIQELVQADYLKLESTTPLEDTNEFSIEVKQVILTAQGSTYLTENAPEQQLGPKTLSFLEKVMLKAGLDDLYDARDITEVVFRTMRDLMPNEVADRIAAELDVQAYPTEDQALGKDVAVLWQDTNPFVAWLSRIRAPLDIKAETFLFRVQQEGGLQRGIEPDQAVRAVFAATKAELSEACIQEIQSFLPEQIQRMWVNA